MYSFTECAVIQVGGGNVLRALRKSESDYVGFGEVYFSEVEAKGIKGWKRHRLMTMNIVVPVGDIRFMMFRDGRYEEIVVGATNYGRLKIMPGTWVAFEGVGKSKSLLMNFADIEHDPNEVDRVEFTGEHAGGELRDST